MRREGERGERESGEVMVYSVRGKASERYRTAKNEGVSGREGRRMGGRGVRLVDYLKSQTPDCCRKVISDILEIRRRLGLPAGQGSTCAQGKREG